ncbi:hypothetical protein [Thiolinea disciformis]|uniref:hypothetical protein n=1 Tax=Thiolinea disciformis TaxID=125614 RepID=UPI00035CFF0C|nr:hypothetical protein [Thiolinea disciformis]
MAKLAKPLVVAVVALALSYQAQAGFYPNQGPGQSYQDQDPYPSYPTQPDPWQYQQYPMQPDPWQQYPVQPEPPSYQPPPVSQPPAARPPVQRPNPARPAQQQRPQQQGQATQVRQPQYPSNFRAVRPCHIDPRPPCFNKYQQ